MFYKTGVDISSVKSMWEFLHNHFTYSTMNSWNGMKSIAHNVKLYNLKLSGDWTRVLQFMEDEADSAGLQLSIDDAIREFGIENPGYRVGFNGRSGGYLVLYNADNYRSILPDCVDDFECYEDFKSYCKDFGYTLSDYKYELRNTVAIVRKFDQLCDELRDLIDSYSVADYTKYKLEGAVDNFNMTYGDDLDSLGFDGPEVIDDHVELNQIADYQAFMTCFYLCLGSDSQRAYVNGNQLYLKED